MKKIFEDNMLEFAAFVIASVIVGGGIWLFFMSQSIHAPFFVEWLFDLNGYQWGFMGAVFLGIGYGYVRTK
jgi:hypothetical protein